jgi:hypothetical protein
MVLFVLLLVWVYLLGIAIAMTRYIARRCEVCLVPVAGLAFSIAWPVMMLFRGGEIDDGFCVGCGAPLLNGHRITTDIPIIGE